jgi:hypothetical protein
MLTLKSHIYPKVQQLLNLGRYDSMGSQNKRCHSERIFLYGFKLVPIARQHTKYTYSRCVLALGGYFSAPEKGSLLDDRGGSFCLALLHCSFESEYRGERCRYTYGRFLVVILKLISSDFPIIVFVAYELSIQYF